MTIDKAKDFLLNRHADLEAHLYVKGHLGEVKLAMADFATQEVKAEREKIATEIERIDSTSNGSEEFHSMVGEYLRGLRDGGGE